jgi:GNAT superfamily N-acetyltransferase
MDDIRHTYAASWNYATARIKVDRPGQARCLDLDLERRDRREAQTHPLQQHAWLPLLPIPIDVPVRASSSFKHTRRVKRMSVDSHGDILECRRVRPRDTRALCQFLDRHLPEFDPGLPLSVLLNSTQCHAWVVQAVRGGWEDPFRRDFSILEELRYDTPPSTPPGEGHLARRMETEGEGEVPMDHRLPILGCLITRVLNKVPSDYDTSNRPATIVHFMALAVDPEHRRMGIADTLVEQAVRKAGIVASRLGAGLHGTDMRSKRLSASISSPATNSLPLTTISSSSNPAAWVKSSVTNTVPPFSLASTISTKSPDYFSNTHDTYSQDETAIVSISLRAEGIFRRLPGTGEKDESSMLFWESMGLTARPTRIGGRKGWEGSGVREIHLDT